MSGPVRYCGRDFPEAALDRIRALLAQRDPPLSRAALSRAVCTALDWRKPDGGLKQMSARVALLCMQRDGQLLALLGCGAAAWKTAPRDRFVGWDPATRQRNLPLVVNHARYLILPWIRLPSLATQLLACLQRQLPADSHQRYAIRPVLLETFCQTPRFLGTCYRAANWIHLGQTQGRGKLDSRHEYAKPVKNVFVKPLCPDWKAILNR